MHPDVRRVVAHEYRHVAHDLDGPRLAVRTQRRPLFEEGELQRFGGRDLICKIFADTLQRLWLAPRQLARPFAPRPLLVARAQNVEERKVVEPPCILLLEALEASARAVTVTAQEVTRRFV